MLSKTRTTIITLVAAFSFAGAAIVPTVAQAKRKKPAPVTCPDEGLGAGNPGDIIEWNEINDDGRGFHIAKKICGADGKWHRCVRSGSSEPQNKPEPGSPEPPKNMPESASPPPTRPTPPPATTHA